MPILRPSDAHAETLARLGQQTFAETFVGKSYYTEEIIGGYTAVAFDPERLRAELADPSVQYLLLEDGGAALGYAKLVEREPPPCVTATDAIYVERLYVKLGTQRRGHGKALLEAIFHEARLRRRSWLWLSVWEHNDQALAFYAKHGFHRAGEWDWAFESHGVRYVDLDYIMMVRVPA
jgi:ribosomal protein S18 acetylase RimI-like enzyme